MSGRGRVAIVYNEPVVGRYHVLGEGAAVEVTCPNNLAHLLS